jgi:hypothetical protein
MRVGIRTLQAIPLIGILHLVPIVDNCKQALRKGYRRPEPGMLKSSRAGACQLVACVCLVSHLHFL